ncbi:hypothetical protein ElyMa_004178200 [Elysia marginata]|uniref:Uncharacterized protein n=1 Tax=Elysia marginata TaxID=1093978 RepID=A0AAV4GLN5_9GAST|nr:hypothetical protein ElyMa_004178200 [Elysia marginata]
MVGNRTHNLRPDLKSDALNTLPKLPGSACTKVRVFLLVWYCGLQLVDICLYQNEDIMASAGRSRCQGTGWQIKMSGQRLADQDVRAPAGRSRCEGTRL